MRNLWTYPVVAAMAAGMTWHSAPAEAGCKMQSPAHALALIELYTSEGCNSCPPADRWLSRVAGEAFRAGRAVPLSLHVDYWDRLGWKDRFASARFTERQYALSRIAGSRFVYTPGVFLNQRELRGWSSPATFRDALLAINARPTGADIRIELDAPSPVQLAIHAGFRINPGAPARQPRAFVALYESGLSTEVQAGENRGASLRHDYVVREWFGPVAVDGTAELRKIVKLEREWQAKNLGVAAFVEDLAKREVLQAAALAMCAPG